MDQIGVYLTHPWVPSRLAALRWVSMLLGKLPGQLWPLMDAELFPLLMQTLQDPDEEVVRLDLEVLARISLNRSNQLDQDKFDLMLDRLVKMFRADRKFLELRGSLVVRQLGVLLNGESIFRALSGILEDEEPEFASLMVQTLNLVGDPACRSSVVVVAAVIVAKMPVLMGPVAESHRLGIQSIAINFDLL